MTELDFIADYAQDPPVAGLVADLTALIERLAGDLGVPPVGLKLAILYAADAPPYADDGAQSLIEALDAAIVDLAPGNENHRGESVQPTIENYHDRTYDWRDVIRDDGDLSTAWSDYGSAAMQYAEGWFEENNYPSDGENWNDMIVSVGQATLCVYLAGVVKELMQP